MKNFYVFIFLIVSLYCYSSKKETEENDYKKICFKTIKIEDSRNFKVGDTVEFAFLELLEFRKYQPVTKGFILN